MSDLSSPTGQKNLFKTYSTFFGGVARLGCPNLQYFAFPASVSFLDFRSPISTVSIPFGMGRGGSGMSQLPVLCIPGFRFFFLASSVPFACDTQKYFRSSLLFGEREATTGNTSALR